MIDKNKITAIILAGGKSSRIGQDKGLVQFRGKRLIEYVIEAAKSFTDSIIIITSNPDYKQFGYPCVEDELKEKGPLGGIVTGLTHSSTPKNFLLGCDMPFISKNVFTALKNAAGNEDVLLTQHKGLAEPLCSLYDRSCIIHIKSCIEQNQLKITDALVGLSIKPISFDHERWFTGNEFANINTIEELRKFGG